MPYAHYNRRIVIALFTALLTAAGAHATDQGITGKKLLIKGGSSPKVVVLSKHSTLTVTGSDPIGGSDSSITFDDGTTSNPYSLPASNWSANSSGGIFKYKNPAAPAGPSVVKIAKLKTGLLKVVTKGLPFAVPNGPATVNVLVSLDGGSNTYCMSFSGTGDGVKFLVKDADAGSCAPAQSCGNDVQEGTEYCDGTDDAACPGNCSSSCTCTCLGSGTAVGGSCWFAGGIGEDCNTVCSNESLAYDAATEMFAGSGGSDANCLTLVNAFGPGGPFDGSADCTGFGGLGCVYLPGGTARCATPPTSASASYTLGGRICACHVPPCEATTGGFCWFLGAQDDSCYAVCGSKGRGYDTATATYAGSGGSDVNCEAVLDDLGAPASPLFSGGCGSGVGCSVDIPGGERLRCTWPLTGQFDDGGSRACACKTPDTCEATTGGFCWYLGLDSQDCDVLCESKGRIYDNATATYAGSGGTDANCQAVMSDLGVPGTVIAGSCFGGGLGCVYDGFINSAPVRCTSPATASWASFSSHYRACACQ